MEAPIRQYQLKVTIGGDTLEDVKRALRQIEFDLNVSSSKQCVSGGFNNGWSWELRHDPEMDHMTYVEKLHEYLHYLEKKEE